jgi:hypothetical protein
MEEAQVDGFGAVDTDPWHEVPAVPLTIQDTGIPESFLRELILKTVWAHDMPS